MSILLKGPPPPPAYVLLIDPGDCKAAAFKSEQIGGLGIDVPARAEAFLESTVDSDIAG